MDMLRTGIWGQGLQEKSMGGSGRAKGLVEVQLRHCSVRVSIIFLSRVQSCSPFASSPKYTELLTITFSATSCLFCRGETRPEPLVLSHLTDCPGASEFWLPSVLVIRIKSSVHHKTFMERESAGQSAGPLLPSSGWEFCMSLIPSGCTVICSLYHPHLSHSPGLVPFKPLFSTGR